MAQSSVPIRAVGAKLRHKGIRSTMRYEHLAPETVRGVAATLVSRSRFGHGYSQYENASEQHQYQAKCEQKKTLIKIKLSSINLGGQNDC